MVLPRCRRWAGRSTHGRRSPRPATTRAGAWIREDGPQEGVFPGGPGWKGSTYPRSCKAAMFLFEVCPSSAMMTSRLLVTNSREMPWCSRLQASRSLKRMTDGLRTLCQPMFCGLKGRGNPAHGENAGTRASRVFLVHPEGGVGSLVRPFRPPGMGAGLPRTPGFTRGLAPAAPRAAAGHRSLLAEVGSIARGGRVRNAIVTRSNSGMEVLHFR